MAWKATGQPPVRKQRGKWVVRVDGIDTVTGKHKPKQLGTCQSQCLANAAAREMRAEDVAVTRPCGAMARPAELVTWSAECNSTHPSWSARSDLALYIGTSR